MEKKNIAIVYSKGDLISKGKSEIISFLNSKKLLNNRGVANVQSTDCIDIHWINEGKRNLTKVFDKYEFIKVFNIDVDNEDLPNKIINTNWVEDIKKEIKKAFGDKELVYIPIVYSKKKYIEEQMIYKIDQHERCFKTKEEANKYLVEKIQEENKTIINQLKSCYESLSLNYKYLGLDIPKDMLDGNNICLIAKKFKDGEIEEIKGFTLTEKEAQKEILNLKQSQPLYESSYFDYEIITKL